MTGQNPTGIRSPDLSGGNCYGSPEPDLWFDNDETSERIAVEICRACPLVTECRDYSVRSHEPFGIWGGLNPLDRRRAIRREQRAQTA